MRLSSLSFSDGQALPSRYAFCQIDAKSHVALADNQNPHLAWSDLPEGTQSLVVICHDPDAPSKPDDVNQEDREIPEDLPRVTFYHWVLINVSLEHDEIEECVFSNGVTPGGKEGPAALGDALQGVNDYTSWFADDEEMRGDYYGYDGPCPPWNDAIVHRYIFTAYALSVPKLELADRFTAEEVLNAMAGKILDQASLTGTYTLNPRLAPTDIGGGN